MDGLRARLRDGLEDWPSRSFRYWVPHLWVLKVWIVVGLVVWLAAQPSSAHLVPVPWYACHDRRIPHSAFNGECFVFIHDYRQQKN